MGYSQENGYVPTELNTIMLSIMENLNLQFEKSFTFEEFQGTDFYKYYYALAQEAQANEVKTSEIFLKLQGYFDETNAQIARPSTTNPGIIDKFTEAGYVASVKPMIEADAGKIHICVDADDGVHASGNITVTSFANLVSGTDDSVGVAGVTFTAQAGAATPGAGTFQAATSNAATAESLALQINSHATANLLVRARAVGAVVEIEALQGGTGGNAIALAYTDNDTNIGATKSGVALTGGETNAEYADIKTEIVELIAANTVGGAVTQGLESEAVVLTNGQSFDFKFCLPEKIPVELKLTITLSDNNTVVVGDPDDTKAALMANIAARYKLGKNFEPQRYFSLVDAPWAASVLLEWSYDGSTWFDDVFEAEFDQLFEILLENITLIEA